MSPEAFVRSEDLRRLRAEGYAVRLLTTATGSAFLLVEDVPYVAPAARPARGVLVSPIGLVDGVAEPPSEHTVHFVGETPSDERGGPLAGVVHSAGVFEVAPGVSAGFVFSNKRADGRNFSDLYEKMTHYVGLLEPYAQAIDPSLSSRMFPPVPDDSPDGPFLYVDSATSRNGTGVYAERLVVAKVAIVGLGGTGSYVLDLLAKTPVGEIHLFDGDDLLSHNAFRAPGAASIEDLRDRPRKVDYYASRYGRMKRGIVTHAYHLDGDNARELHEMGFVFLCMEGGAVKRQLVEAMEEMGLSFIDVGLGVEAGGGALGGALQVTTSTPEHRGHLRGRVNLADVDDEDLYGQNIQIADLNALNAALAVVKWKKLRGFYRDEDAEHYCAYGIDGNTIVNEATSAGPE